MTSRHCSQLGFTRLIASSLLACLMLQGCATPQKDMVEVIPDRPALGAVAIAAARQDPQLQYGFARSIGDPEYWADSLIAFQAAAHDNNPVAATASCALIWQRQKDPAALERALDWCRSAATQGYGPAQLLLALIEHDELSGLERDQDALHWLRLAADQGDILARIQLGRQYFLGEGVPADPVLGGQLLDQVVALNRPESDFTQSLLNRRRGMRPALDIGLANAKLLQAAQANLWIAQVELADYAWSGAWGIPYDRDRSHQLREQGLVNLLIYIRDWAPQYLPPAG
jgi:TPR repeat protein